MSVVGIIFSNIHDKSIPELTRLRTMASVPFGCRYRLIDFTLSNMVNSGIKHVGIITHYNYQSLMDHLGSGIDWDLARRAGGIKILPPYITAFASVKNFLYSTRLEALKNIATFINECKEEYVVLSDCDVICNINLSDIIERHISTGADVTFVTKSMDLTNMNKGVQIIRSDRNGLVTSVEDSQGNETGMYDINANILVMNRRFLVTELMEATAHNYTSFMDDIISRELKYRRIMAYKFDGYFGAIDSMSDYYRSSMELLNADVRRQLFNIPGRPVLTKVRNSPPTKYASTAVVKNSLIADGCVIEGTVENSVLFRGVKIGRGTRVRNSILMQDTLTGEDVYLNAVITDKNVVIRDGRVLSGHETVPFYLAKLMQV